MKLKIAIACVYAFALGFFGVGLFWTLLITGGGIAAWILLEKRLVFWLSRLL